MKLSISWLKTFVNTKLSAEKIADKLTMVGLEVDDISCEQDFSNVVVGHVLSVENHPNADKLHIAKVQVTPVVIPSVVEESLSDLSTSVEMTDTGILQIVCGATNLAKGQKVPVALVGAKLGDYEITKANLRGVDSYGMICSERELGISDEHSGIMVLDKDAEVGSDVSLLLGGDKVLDVKVLANRPDCMSIIGLANEVAVAVGDSVTISPIKLVEKEEKVKFEIKVEDNKLCPRYIARFVTGLKRGETPKWMKERLISSGIRPIDLFVDISNYVMLEYGQPLHFFDLDKLTDKTIIVRLAKNNEEITTLDGIKRKLIKDNLVIADAKKPIAIAGVMGGIDTEIDENTKNILIEAAVFDKASIRRTSRALGLRSEAVARFEKGIAHMLPEVAINRAAEMLQDLGKGSVSKTIIDIDGVKEKEKSIILEFDKMNAFLGTKITEAEALDILKSLGFGIKKQKNVFEITPPFWRTDILEPVDLYEEVIRIAGYDKVPYTIPYGVEAIPEKNVFLEHTEKIRNQLSANGFTEVLTYSFVGGKDLATLGIPVASALEIQNPLVSDQQYLRPTLISKMMEAIRDNQFNESSLRFFEIGRSFERISDGKLPKETNWLTLGMTSDFYDIKGIIFNLFSGLGVSTDDIVIKQTTIEFLKKGIGADLYVQGKKVASIGEIREEVRDKFDIKRNVVVAQINLDTFMSLELPVVKFSKFSKYQKTNRDVSVIFSDDVTVADIRQKLSRVNKLITKVEIIDVYKGKNLNSDEKSITIRFEIQSDDHTLTDKEVDEVIQIVDNKITDIGGKLRGGR